MHSAADIAAEAQSVNTQASYKSAVESFLAFCAEHAVEPTLPVSASVFAAWVGHLAGSGAKLNTIRARSAAIKAWHRSAGAPSPTDDPKIQTLMKGLARRLGSAVVKKQALTADMVQKMVEGTSPRDRAILLIGFTTGMRRSELAALRWDDVEDVGEGLLLKIRKSKTDQEGHGQSVAIPSSGGDLCTVETFRRLKKLHDPSQGDLVFGCGDRTIANVVKRAVASIGMDESVFGAHSFRSGFASEARKQGASLDDIMEQTRHKSDAVARGYIQGVDKMNNKAVHGVVNRLSKRR